MHCFISFGISFHSQDPITLNDLMGKFGSQFENWTILAKFENSKNYDCDELVAFLPTIKLEFDPSQMYLCPKNRSALSPMKDFRITFSTKFRGGAPLISSHPTAEQRAKILLAVYWKCSMHFAGTYRYRLQCNIGLILFFFSWSSKRKNQRSNKWIRKQNLYSFQDGHSFIPRSFYRIFQRRRVSSRDINARRIATNSARFNSFNSAS